MQRRYRTRNTTVGSKVKQGGYFYVFWVNSFTGTEMKEKAAPGVSFSVYLTSQRPSLESFDTIISGQSTAADVKEIDPGFQLNFAYSSSGPYSYSYLNADSVLEIEYEWSKERMESNKDHADYEDLVVVGKKVLPRIRGKNTGEIRLSIFSRILEKDLPFSRNELIIRGVCIGSAVLAVLTFVTIMVIRKKGRLGKNSSFGV